MPITFVVGDLPQAIFSGRCAPDEADALLEWLRTTSQPAADLGTCDALHTALVQLLIVARVHITAPPPDAVLAACLRAAGCVTSAPHQRSPPQQQRVNSLRPARGGKRAAKAASAGGAENINLGAV
jgi:hypothetical protein